MLPQITEAIEKRDESRLEIRFDDYSKAAYVFSIVKDGRTFMPHSIVQDANGKYIAVFYEISQGRR